MGVGRFVGQSPDLAMVRFVVVSNESGGYAKTFSAVYLVFGARTDDLGLKLSKFVEESGDALNTYRRGGRLAPKAM